MPFCYLVVIKMAHRSARSVFKMVVNRERGLQVGYFKQQEISDQKDIDRLVGWYRYHRDKLPASYIEWLLKDDELLWAAIRQWENVPYAPIPAKKHVALSFRDDIRQERARKRLKRRDHAIFYISLVVIVLASASMIVWLSL